ncbi:MAG: FGGY family carbohydrate kinase [Myxococcota bacterium]|nr:FGGY family carbohydrate kinase [Myxococcota bacterium]
MAHATLLGIDIGTTGVRAAVYDEAGRVVAHAAEASSPATPTSGQVEGDADDWWRAVRTVVAQMGDRTPLTRIDAIGVTGQAPTAVLIDGNGELLRRAILWLDVRADAEAREIEGKLGPGGAEAIGGNRMHAYYLGPKLAWLRAHELQSFERAALVLQSHAFIVMRLTGEAACDLSTAMLCAPLFDAQSCAWSQPGADASGVPIRVLPHIAPAHQVVGSVTRAAAEATGLRAGTPVVAGGADFAASALGAGVIDEGEACLMLGTSGNLLMPMAEPHFDSRLINSHHVGCDRWLALGGTLCGAALTWFRNACAPGVAWEALEQEAAGVSVETIGGLLALPYFQGERTPIWDESTRGVFFGLDLTHHRGHLYRALLDGVALGFRHCLAVAEEHGTRFSEVVAANGAGRSAILRQTLADALGMPLTWRDGTDAGNTVAGAALLAGIGAGALSGAHVARAWLGSGVRHEPNWRAHERLCDVFTRRLALYVAVRGARSTST